MTARALKVVDAAADAAASEAAREERADAQEQAAKSTTSKKPSKAPADGWHRFIVDVWITNFNFTEFGIYKRSRNRAKSRQFTSDMDIFAEIIENGERTGLIGYREELWEKAQGMDKRLVFKLFNETVNWRATMDLMLGRSLQQTLGARGLPGHDLFDQYRRRQLHRLSRALGQQVALHARELLVLPHWTTRASPSSTACGAISSTSAATTRSTTTRATIVGALDGKVFSIGGKWKGKVKAGHADKRLLTVLKMFGGMMIFNADCRRHMRRLWKDVMTRQG